MSLNTVVALIYPPTKAKLRRLLHIGGTLLTLAILVATWATQLPLQTQIEVSIGTIVVALTNISAALSKAEAVVEKLPIPEDSGKKVDPAAPMVPASEAPTKLEKIDTEKSR
jgi:hypothetical protein